MMNFKKVLLLVLLNVTVIGNGASIPSDDIKVGKRSSVADKGFTFDTGDGGSNVSLKVDDSRKMSFDGNEFSIGDGASSNDKFLTIDPQSGAYIGWDGTNGALIFDNGDGPRNIGSGSGSGGAGSNVVANSDFEANANDWTASAGTFEKQAVEIGNGENSAKWTPTNTAQTLSNDAVQIPNTLNGKSCLAKFQYRYTGGANGDITVQVKNGSDVLVEAADIVLTPSANEWQEVAIGFLCPSASSPQLVFTTAVASPQPLYLDDVWVGTDYRLGSLDQAIIVGAVPFTPTSSITGGSVQGSYSRVGNRMEGHIVVQSATTWNGDFLFDVPDGLTVDEDEIVGILSDRIIVGDADATDSSANLHYAGHVYLTSTNKMGILGGPVVSIWDGANNPFVWQNANDRVSINFSIPIVEWKEGTNKPAINVDGSDWYISADITATGDVTMGLTAGSLGTINSSTWVASVRDGSKDAGITCATLANTVEGDKTCGTGDEALGISYRIPRAGLYEVCYEFVARLTTSAANGQIFMDFRQRIHQTDGTILRTGNEKSHRFNAGQSSLDIHNPMKFCDVYKHDSGLYLTTLQRENVSMTAANTNAILSNSGDGRAVQVTVRPVYSGRTTVAIERDDFVEIQLTAPNTPIITPSDLLGTYTIPKDGYYLVECDTQYSNSENNAVNVRFVETDIQVDNVDVIAALGTIIDTGGGSEYLSIKAKKALNLTTGQVINCEFVSTTSTTISLGSSHLRVQRIGEIKTN